MTKENNGQFILDDRELTKHKPIKGPAKKPAAKRTAPKKPGRK